QGQTNAGLRRPAAAAGLVAEVAEGVVAIGVGRAVGAGEAAGARIGAVAEGADLAVGAALLVAGVLDLAADVAGADAVDAEILAGRAGGARARRVADAGGVGR